MLSTFAFYREFRYKNADLLGNVYALKSDGALVMMS